MKNRSIIKYGLVMFIGCLSAVNRGACASEVPYPETLEIQQLLVANGTRAIIETQISQIEDSVNISFNKTFSNQIPRENVAQVSNDAKIRIHEVIQSKLSWQLLEPQLVEIYARTFSRIEIDALLAFYNSDIGKAVTSKMPLVDSEVTKIVTIDFNSLQGEFIKISNDALSKIKK
jgi:hypothetical protein